MYKDQPTMRVPYVAAGEAHSDAPKGAARPIGNSQQMHRRANMGATVADAARPHAVSQRLTLSAFEIVLASVTTGARGSGAVLMRSNYVINLETIPPKQTIAHKGGIVILLTAPS